MYSHEVELSDTIVLFSFQKRYLIYVRPNVLIFVPKSCIMNYRRKVLKMIKKKNIINLIKYHVESDDFGGICDELAFKCKHICSTRKYIRE